MTEEQIDRAIAYARIVVREADANRFDAPRTEELARALLSISALSRDASREEDADAMALVKKLGVMIWPPRFNKGRTNWLARIEDDNQNVLSQASNADLNSAIRALVGPRKPGQ